MKAKVTGGNKNITKEITVNMEKIKEEWMEYIEEAKKKKEEEKSKPINLKPKTSYINSRLEKIEAMISNITIYHFDIDDGVIVKCKPNDVYENLRKNTICFLIDTNKCVDCSWEQGELYYHNIWLPEENDELALKCFKKHCKSKIIKHMQEIARLEYLAEQEWKIS